MRMRSPAGIAALTALALVALGLIVALVPDLRRRASNLLPRTWQIALVGWRSGFSVDHSLRIAMPDGTRLAASLYLPAQRSAPLATILVRVPYGRLRYGEAYGSGMFFAKNGYAVLVADLRGTGDSGGELLPWADAAADGVALLDWVARQSWSNGKVGTFGCSALGETQLVLASRRHPAHAAMIASGAGGAIGSMQGRHGYFGLYEGGVFQLASGFGWFAENGSKDPHAPAARAFDTAATLKQLPLSRLVANVRPAASGYSDFLATPLGDPRWERWGYLTDADRLTTPAFIINTWNDQTVGDALVIAEYQRRMVPQAARDQRVVIAPGPHCQHEEAQSREEFGNLTARGEAKPFREWYLAWFDRWLRGQGAGLAALPAYTYFMLAENRWYGADRWPPADSAVQRWYLDSKGGANTRAGDGRLALVPPQESRSDSFVYDPMDPVMSRGGPLCCTGDPREQAGTVDQSEVEARKDVLVYTSEPLTHDLRIAGPLKVMLTVSSSAPDTDLVARLVDVLPDGRALNIQEGALRLRYRDGVPPKLLEPGARYSVSVDLRSIAYRVAQGHRLRLDVTSSSFPRLERNLNTGRNNYEETEARVATNNLHHGPEERAWIELPVLSSQP
jgi:putative CocE/NonD family hydrolase